jgi:UDP-2-acetamido-3-amino-2,3-dideoxy-glucuronate N-acetyltransferase
LYEGVELEAEVFVGPSAVLTNVANPRAAISRRGEYGRIMVRRGATIGANATILPGITLDQHCFVAAGAVVRRDVPAFALVLGVPARIAGWVSRRGERLEFDSSGLAACRATGERYRRTESGVELLAER